MSLDEALPPDHTFYHVRVGGPKEKRIRRVELMGEHAPRPVYFVKISQPVGSNYLSKEEIMERISSLGHVAKVYRPNNAEKIPMEFALVGFFEESAVQQALDHPDLSSLLGSDGVTAGTVKPWLLELYPEKPFQY